MGRTNDVLRADPSARDPLRGMDHLDLRRYSDRQLHALTEALLVEKHRRNSRWLAMVPELETITDGPTT